MTTGYQYFGARYYNSDISVWLSVDPLADKYPMISPYAYVFNNPINKIDRWGLEGEDPERFGIGKRFKNWMKGDKYKNKANQFAAENGITNQRTDEDGNIIMSKSENWQSVDENGAISGVNEKTYKFSKNSVTITTDNSNLTKTTNEILTWKSFLSMPSNKNLNKGLAGFLGINSLINGAAMQSLYDISSRLDVEAHMFLGKAARVTKGLGIVGIGISLYSDFNSLRKNWNTEDRGYYMAKLTGSIIISGTAAIPIVGAFVSTGLGAIDAGGGFEGIYDNFR